MKQLKIGSIQKHVVLDLPMKSNNTGVEYVFNNKIMSFVYSFINQNKQILNYDFINGMTEHVLEFWFDGNISDEEIKIILKPLLLELSKDKYAWK